MRLKLDAGKRFGIVVFEHRGIVHETRWQTDFGYASLDEGVDLRGIT
jgi:hypothetical protein